LNIDYKDPLFSVIIFLLLIIIAILVTHFLGVWREKSRVKDLDEFMDKFNCFDNLNIKDILENRSDNINSILLLAMAFEKEGSYDKSLNIYLSIIDMVSNKYEILKKIANLYIKIGFLQKSRETLHTVLKRFPRDKEALKMLFFVNDKLTNYDEMSEIIEIFDELDEDIQEEIAYLEMRLYESDVKKNSEKLKVLYKKYPILKRFYFEEYLRINPYKAFSEIKEEDIYSMIDIIWSLEIPNKNQTFCNILAAKHKTSCSTPAPFEIEVLKQLPSEIAILDFEYICNSCKNIFPIYEYRCPKCKTLFSMEVEMKLESKNREKLPQTF
jgi:tetratricopeptide (TPR) repeat protein